MDMSDARNDAEQTIQIDKRWYRVEPGREVKLSRIPSYVAADHA
ncbi:MAG: hypothetical protein ACQESR_22545 [Planctomycetota bacterium]